MFGNGKVFISHTHEDNDACAPVLAALDAWQVDYWFDKDQLSAGLELLDNIQQAQQGRDIFLRICTPAANASPWMTQEQHLARSLRAPNGDQRLMIDLIMKPGYVASADEKRDLVIDATRQPEIDWLRRLREALGVPSRERRVSRRAVLSVGITSLVALGGMGFASKLLFFTSPSPNLYHPVGHQPTPTALPGASRIRWTFGVDPVMLGGTMSVVPAGEAIICGNSGLLCALSGADGKLLWGTEQRYSGLNMSVPPPVVGDTIYVSCIDIVANPKDPNSTLNNVYLVALKTSDGSERWRQLIVTSGPDANNYRSAVTVASHRAYIRYNQTLHAFDATTGKALWSASAGAADATLDEILPAPTVMGDVVFAVLGDRKLHALSAIDGAPLWPAPFASDLPIRTQPVAGHGVVYVGADGGWCYALDPATARIHWKEQLLKKPTPSFTSLGLTLSGNALYISGGFPLKDFSLDNSLHGGAIQALNPATGKILWSCAPDEQLKLGSLAADLLPSTARVVGDEVFVCSRLHAVTGKNVNILYAINKATGKVKWDFQMWGAEDVSGASAFPSAPVIAGNMLYVISGNETVYAISYSD